MSTPSREDDAVAMPEVTENSSRWRKPLIAVILLVVLIAGAMVGVHYWRYATTHESTDDAAVSSDIVQVAPQVSGTVVQVLVQDNQLVTAGTPLVVLDDATYRAAVAQARANLDMAVAQAKGAGVSVSLTEETGAAQLQQAEGVVAQADSGISSAEADVNRADAGVINAEAVAKSVEANVQTAEASLVAAQANKEKALSSVIAAQAQVDTATATVHAADANVNAAQAGAEKARSDAKRYSELLSKGAVSASTAEHATSAATTALAQVDAAQRQVDAAQAQVAARQADLTAARRQVDAADAAVSQARAQISAAQAQVSAAKAGITQVAAQRQGVKQGVKQAQARRDQALGQLTQAKTTPHQVDVSRSAQAQATAKVEQARAALETALIQLRYTHIVAPVTGYVSKKSVETGALVQPGTPLMAIVPARSLWVTANYKETQLDGMREGAGAVIKVDALPGMVFHGHVDSVAAGTGSTFALLPADNATGNYTKVIQRIPVKIVLDDKQPGLDRVRAGMSVTAIVATR